MKKKLLVFLVLGFLSLFFPLKISAWGGDIHQYLCPPNLSGDCTIADDYHFKQTYPFGGVWHLCLDNKPDCPARLLAKYYVKKYFAEGGLDQNLLEAAAHLIQDSYVPDHWFPMREFFGRIFVPFAPSWLGTTERKVSKALIEAEPGWNISLDYQDQKVTIDEAYLAMIREESTRIISAEPTEDLRVLAKQVQDKDLWQKVRSYREWLWLAVVMIFLFVISQVLRYLAAGEGRGNLLMGFFFLLITLTTLVLGYLFY